MRLFYTTLLISLCILLAPPAHAQIPGAADIDTLSLEVSPQTPGPNTDITVRARSFSFDIDTSQVTWQVNGAVVQQGTGAGTLTTSTGELGEQMEISVEVRTADDIVVSDTITLQPAAVDVIWEGNTYTPPLYKGRALQSPDASVTFVAIPHFIGAGGTRISPGNLIYTWRRGTEVLGNQSGTGRRSITITNPGKLRDLDVSVEVHSPDKTIQGIGFATSPVTRPRIAFYESHPLLGTLFSNMFSNDVSLGSAEMEVVAHPYFVSRDAYESDDIVYTWQVDGDTVPTDTEQPRKLTLRPEGQGAGSAAVSLEVRNVAHILQSAQRAFTARFNTN